jgi:hypothetical protein
MTSSTVTCKKCHQSSRYLPAHVINHPMFEFVRFPTCVVYACVTKWKQTYDTINQRRPGSFVHIYAATLTLESTHGTGCVLNLSNHICCADLHDDFTLLNGKDIATATVTSGDVRSSFRRWFPDCVTPLKKTPSFAERYILLQNNYGYSLDVLM